MSEKQQTARADSPGGKGSPNYTVVARRYRPKGFDELVGQSFVGQALAGAIRSDRIGHAYLFTGARGVGKTSTARIFAKALNCEKGPTPEPCNQCDICQSIAAGTDIDVLEIDGASNRGIDEIRQLRQNVGVRPSRARYKVYIIDEVHMLTREAFNALLKTLEEPPPHVKFIFCTTEAAKIPITILSRCQRFDFHSIAQTDILARLQAICTAEGVAADEDALRVIAKRAAGSMRDSQSLLEQVLSLGLAHITAADVHRLLGTVTDGHLSELLAAIFAADAAACLRALDHAISLGVDCGQLLEQLLGCFRDVLAAAAGCPPSVFLFAPDSAAEWVAQAGKSRGPDWAIAAMQVLENAVSKLRYSTQPRLIAELAMVRLCRLDALASLPRLLAEWSAGPGPASSSPKTSDGEKKTADLAPSYSEPVRHYPSPKTSEENNRPHTQIQTPTHGRPLDSSAVDTRTIEPALGSPIPTAHSKAPEFSDQPLALSGNSTKSPPAQPLAEGDGQLQRNPGGLALPKSPSPEALAQFWRELLAELPGQSPLELEDAHIASITEDTMHVLLQAKHNNPLVQSRHAELAVAREALAGAAARRLGRSVKIECRFEERGPSTKKPVGQRAVVSQQKLIHEKSQHPIAARAATLLGAQGVRVDPPRE